MLNIEGKILVFLSFFLFTIVPWVFYFKEEDYLWPILLSAILPLAIGLILIGLTRSADDQFNLREAYLLVSVSWVLMGFVGTLPFLFTGTIPGITDALFESVSGFTTTGSSILTDVESLPKSVLYWRSLTHWIGGMGIIILVVAILPNLKIAGYQLFSIELSGFSSEKLKPKTHDIAKRLWFIYIALTIILVVILMAGGLDFYESICHSFGTIATGGFSTKNASIGHYSRFVQYAIMIFMLLSGVNFVLHYFIVKGNFKRLAIDTELKTYLAIVFIVGMAITFILFFTQGNSFEQSFRDSFFQVISIITATGFASADYMQWREAGWMLIFFLMFIGACAGSTGGGIKVIRHVVAYKYIERYFLALVHPNLVKNLHVNGQTITNDKATSIMNFILIYLFIVVLSSCILSVIGVDIQTSIGAVLATIGGIGPGVGLVGPAGNFAFLPGFAKVMLTFLMILGRLEIFAFLIIFSRSFWR